MPKREPITIAGRTFNTKSELRDYIRSIVASYENEDPLDGPDTTFVEALILYGHPQAETKIGPGIDYVIVRRNPVYTSTRGFHLFRVDGTDTDVSWTECLKPTPHYKKVIRALRVLVEPQTMAFKQRFFDENGSVPCPLTGEWITFLSSHVDHVPPLTFDVLVDRFCREFAVDLNAVLLRNELADNVYVDELGDDELAERWVRFHDEHAVLRVVSRLANLSHSKIEARDGKTCSS